MVTAELRDWVKKERGKGVKEYALKAKLEKRGYSKKAIEAAFSTSEKRHPHGRKPLVTLLDKTKYPLLIGIACFLLVSLTTRTFAAGHFDLGVGERIFASIVGVILYLGLLVLSMYVKKEHLHNSIVLGAPIGFILGQMIVLGEANITVIILTVVLVVISGIRQHHHHPPQMINASISTFVGLSVATFVIIFLEAVYAYVLFAPASMMKLIVMPVLMAPIPFLAILSYLESEEYFKQVIESKKKITWRQSVRTSIIATIILFVIVMVAGSILHHAYLNQATRHAENNIIELKKELGQDNFFEKTPEFSTTTVALFVEEEIEELKKEIEATHFEQLSFKETFSQLCKGTSSQTIGKYLINIFNLATDVNLIKTSSESINEEQILLQAIGGHSRLEELNTQNTNLREFLLTNEEKEQMTAGLSLLLLDYDATFAQKTTYEITKKTKQVQGLANLDEQLAVLRETTVVSYLERIKTIETTNSIEEVLKARLTQDILVLVANQECATTECRDNVMSLTENQKYCE